LYYAVFCIAQKNVGLNALAGLKIYLKVNIQIQFKEICQMSNSWETIT